MLQNERLNTIRGQKLRTLIPACNWLRVRLVSNRAMRVLRLPFLTKETLSQLVHRSSKDVCSRTTHQSFKYSLSKFGICTRPVSSNVLTSRSAKIDSRQTTSPSSRNGRSFSWTGRRAEEGSWNGNGSTAEILDGKLHSAEWQQTARIQVDNLKKEHSIHPAVAVYPVAVHCTDICVF